MGKEKQKTNKGVQNQHLHARVSYLHQASTYLAIQANQHNSATSSKNHLADGQSDQINTPPQLESQGLPLLLNHHLRTVAQKSQIRLHTNIKHTICKRCCNPLLENKGGCTKRIENSSKGSKKVWADVLVMECLNCGGVRRFPVGAERQGRKGGTKGGTDVEGVKGEVVVDGGGG